MFSGAEYIFILLIFGLLLCPWIIVGQRFWRRSAWAAGVMPLFFSLCLLPFGLAGVQAELSLSPAALAWRFDLVPALFLFLLALGMFAAVTEREKREGRPLFSAVTFFSYSLALLADNPLFFLMAALAPALLTAFPGQARQAVGGVVLVLPVAFSIAVDESLAAGTIAPFALAGGWYIIGTCLFPFIFYPRGKLGISAGEGAWWRLVWPRWLLGFFFLLRFYWPELSSAERELFRALSVPIVTGPLFYWAWCLWQDRSRRLSVALAAQLTAVFLAFITRPAAGGSVAGLAHLIALSILLPLIWIRLESGRRTQRGGWVRLAVPLTLAGLAGLPPMPSFVSGLTIVCAASAAGGWQLVLAPASLMLAFTAIALEFISHRTTGRRSGLTLLELSPAVIIACLYVLFPLVLGEWGVLLVEVLGY